MTMRTEATSETLQPNVCGFILAAGRGTRLRPATLVRPKALVPFCGVQIGRAHV